MRYFILFLITVFLPIAIIAQTGGNTNNQNNNSNPYSNNPYNNPYESNPYTGNDQTNFLKEQREKENKDGKSTDKKGQQDPNNIDPKKLDPESIKDMNQLKNAENLKNPQNPYEMDPDYQRYIQGNLRATKDSIRTNDEELDKDEKRVYGASFFSNNVFDLSDKSPGTPPSDYRLGPGDEIIISLWGNAELQQSYTLSKDGSIFPRLVGKIFLQGLTFDAASQVVENKFRKIVPANTQIDVQLKSARTIKVTVVGEVKKQGTYTMAAFNTALNALFRAGGVSSVGNMRRIEIIREGRVVDDLDLYEYLQSGSRANEIYLEDNDRIFVGVYEKLVEAKGLFKRPMFYQLKDDEGLKDLIDFAGGTAADARNSLIHIRTIRNEKQVYVDIDWRNFSNGEYENYILNDGDFVQLKSINDGLKNVVTIEGAVDYPDDYEVRNGQRLSELLHKAGGVSSKAYKPRAYVFRAGNSLESDALKIDLGKLDDLENDIIIQPGDRIKILSLKDFEEEYFIEVNGYVRMPKRVPYYKNMKLKDVLLLCGGLRLDAENGRIEISNVVDSVSRFAIESKGNQIKIISIDANLELDKSSENIFIKPMDRIYVRRKSEFLATEKVQIMGEVEYPGEYVLVGRNERLSSIIQRAGGLKKTAYSEGARLFRAKIGQVVIDMNAALKQKNSQLDIGLKDSDLIIIPSLNDIVSIRGEVQSSTSIKFDPSNMDIRYYIAAAGGYGDRPWKNRIYIKYQNGRIKSTKNYLVARVYPKVKEGSTIYVPLKPKKENTTKFSEVFSYSLSALTTLATLLILSRSL